MIADKIKIGDVVQLKSGGPLMRLQTIGPVDALCSWFVEDNEQNGAF